MDSGIQAWYHKPIHNFSCCGCVCFGFLRSPQRDKGVVGPASKGHMSTSKGQVTIQGGRTLAKEFPSIPHLIHVEILNPCSIDATVFGCSGHSTKPFRIPSEFIKGKTTGIANLLQKSMGFLPGIVPQNLGPKMFIAGHSPSERGRPELANLQPLWSR